MSALLFGHQNVASGRDCVELIPRVTWLAASRGQLVFGAGIGPQWEPGGGGGGEGTVCDWCNIRFHGNENSHYKV